MIGSNKSGCWLNGLSKLGLGLLGLGFVGWAVLIVLDFTSHRGVWFETITYMIAPMAIAGAAALVVLGLVARQITAYRRGERLKVPVLDLSVPGAATRCLAVLAILALMGAVAGLGGFRAYHFVESVAFCGELCHTVMEPQHVAHQAGPHAAVTCVECHVGPGIPALIKSKINGLVELQMLAMNTYERPIAPPVKHFRPAEEICGECHDVKMDHGQLPWQRTHFRPDETNSPWTIAMNINVGGGDGGGIHGAHGAESGKTIEYVSLENKRLEIPWVKVTDSEGQETIYQLEDEELSEEERSALKTRRMDCTDCHNRPVHQFLSPGEALDEAFLAGKLDRAIPDLNSTASSLLEEEYESVEEAMEKIAAGLADEYEDLDSIKSVTEVVQGIYKQNFFPEMKVRWEAYPDHIGHFITPGCFRCHDGKHVSESGKRIVKDCDLCHSIVAQGPTLKPVWHSDAQEFKHPDEDVEAEDLMESNCSDCHSGAH